MDDGRKFHNFNQRCNGNTINSLVTFPRVVANTGNNYHYNQVQNCFTVLGIAPTELQRESCIIVYAHG